MVDRMDRENAEITERQRLLDDAAYFSAEEGIRQGIVDFEQGRTLPAEQAFDRIRRLYNISR